MKLLNSVVLSSLLTFNAYGSIVAIIDSGTDHKHKDLTHLMWQNPIEAPHGNNLRDEDGNGYEDDIFGWNFAENNNEVIADKYRGMLTEDIRMFFTIQEKMMRGTATMQEIAWLRSKVQDEDFIKQLSIYGNYMHGTHVGGIAVKGNPNATMLAVKLIPTEVALPVTGDDGAATTEEPNEEPAVGEINPVLDMMIKGFLDQMATQQIGLMTEISEYVGNHKADIANGSFGTGYRQIEMMLGAVLGKILRREPTPEETRKYTLHFFDKILTEGKKMVAASPNTLWVFAAGNDGSNNDVNPTSPTNIQADNVISVAASLGYDSLASFSNYGTKEVDVAAPGVGIYSTAPDDEYISVSGTSQAAPFVAMIASLVKDNNSALNPGEIKKIILGTVDKKGWLATKVKTSGVVNKTRAVKAAELSKTMSVEQAISQSLVEVTDVKSNPNKMGNKSVTDLDAYVLPLPSTLSIRK